MSAHTIPEEAILAAETRRLTERGYTVYRGGRAFLPPALREIEPDAVALGPVQNLVIEIVSDERPNEARLASLREKVALVPGWKLLVLLDRGARESPLEEAPLPSIDAALASAANVLAAGEVTAALLLGWGIFEALARRIAPPEFRRPQTPGRIVQVLAAGGMLSSNEEELLRRLALVRNATIHGELTRTVAKDDVREFLGILEMLRSRVLHPDTAR